jgi:uncharacterized protein YecT (DUF1311 family)
MLALFITTHVLFYLKAKFILLNMIYFVFQSLKEKSPNICQHFKVTIHSFSGTKIICYQENIPTADAPLNKNYQRRD